MAKNGDLFNKLEVLKLADLPGERHKQIVALTAIIEADLTEHPDQLRKAFIDHKAIFGADPGGIFTDADPASDAFLAIDGEGDHVQNNLKALQQLAAQKRVEFGLASAKESANKTVVLKALVSADDAPALRAALATAEAKTIFGDLAGKGHQWDTLLLERHLKSIRDVASSILTTPIHEKIKGLVAEAAPFIAEVTAAHDHIRDAAAAAINDDEIVRAKESFEKLLAKQQELTAYRDHQAQADLLGLPGNAANKAEIDDAVQAADQKVIEAKDALTVQIGKLLEVVADRKAKVDASLADAVGPHANAVAIAASRNDAEKHCQAIHDALELVKLTGVADAVTPAATANKKAAEDALAKLNAHAHASSAEASLADIRAVDVAFTAIAYVPPTQAKPTADDVIKARDLFDSRKADELAKAEARFSAIKEAREQANQKFETDPSNRAFQDAFDRADAALTAAERLMKPMRLKVKANLRMQIDGEGFPGHSFKAEVVKKGAVAAVAAGPAPGVVPVSVAQAQGKIDTYKGVRLEDDQVIRSTEKFDAIPGVGGAPNQPERRGILEQDKTGRVTNVTPAPASSAAKLSLDQQAVLAVRQAKMLLDHYDPKKGPIHVYGGDKDYAQMVIAGLLLQKGHQAIEIRSHVLGCPAPEKAFFQSKADEGYINVTLPSDLVKHVRESSASKFVDATVKKREELEQMKQGGYFRRADAEKGDAASLHVDQTEELDEKKGTLNRGPV